jgi:hypothetical protein
MQLKLRDLERKREVMEAQMMSQRAEFAAQEEELKKHLAQEQARERV